MRLNSNQANFGEKLEEIKIKLSRKEILASIDQLSCLIVDKWWNNLDKIIIKEEVTRSSITRATDAVLNILIRAGFEKVGVSVRGGMMTDISLAKELLNKSGLLFSSGDMPIRNMFGMNSLKHWIEDVTVEEKRPWSLAQLVGYRLHNVPNIRTLREKYLQLKQCVDSIDGHKMIRWDIYGIRDDEKNIVPLLDNKTALAIEYYPRFGKPDDFFREIDRLRASYPKKQIGISFDPVYYLMAAKLYKGCLAPEKYFKKIIQERPDQLMMVEVNQIASGQLKPHTAIAGGRINHNELFYDWGKAYRGGRLYYVPHFAYEPAPKFYEQLMKEGKEYMIKLNESFAGNDQWKY